MSSLGYKRNTNVLVYKSLKERAFWQQKQLDDANPVLYKTLIYRCIRNDTNTFSIANDFAECKLCNENSLTPFTESKFSIFDYLEDINKDKPDYTFLLEIDNINSVDVINSPDSFVNQDYTINDNKFAWSQYANPINAYGYKQPQVGITAVHKRTNLFKNLLGLGPLTVSYTYPTHAFLDMYRGAEDIDTAITNHFNNLIPLSTDKIQYASRGINDYINPSAIGIYCTEQLYLIHHNGSYERPGVVNDTITQEITHTRNLNKI